MTAIVVVDDRASNRRIISKLASSIEDAEVTAFADPLTALAYVEGHTPDLLITDYKMEPINGDELIRRFRCVPACADVPTIVITSFHDVEFRDRALRAGSTNFLMSPVDHEDFRSRLRGLLAIQRERRLFYDEARSPGDGVMPIERSPVDNRTEMVSEMLQVVNLHLVATLAELELVQGDCNAVTAETQLAAIFVDAVMKVRRFTPAILGILGGDADGRRCSLEALTEKLAYRDLAEDFQRMLMSEEPVQRYLESTNGTHYLVKLLPNYRADRSIAGAVITFTKIAVWRGGNG